MMRVAAFLAAAVLLAGAPARAADGADPFDVYETTLSGEGATPAFRVAFDGKDCGECYTASLFCLDFGGIAFEFGDVEAKNAAGAITRDARAFSLDAGGTAFAFSITGLSYGGDMNGTWVVDGELTGSDVRAAFTAALVKTDRFKATIGAESLTLPVTADVKTWAAACKP
jgi:hypothetical protein